MSQSRRARRMERRHKRSKVAGLSLVSMMDIFTILVFFLMVNSSEVEVMQNTEGVRLPESITLQKPENTLVVSINQDQIYVDGKPVADTKRALSNSLDTIPTLRMELDRLAALAAAKDPTASDFAATIMGDKEIPYRLLKKILATCAQSRYTHLSLAVNHIPGDEG
jgi:biopolymer transport protein TolR